MGTTWAYRLLPGLSRKRSTVAIEEHQRTLDSTYYYDEPPELDLQAKRSKQPKAYPFRAVRSIRAAHPQLDESHHSPARSSRPNSTSIATDTNKTNERLPYDNSATEMDTRIGAPSSGRASGALRAGGDSDFRASFY
ncbi:hypothetical protein Salat_2504600 [Sesamum alatum]|uniref:Uncharacterized protein n=1 Tax=Sesamum alatum TaxID=300844 RepID=A0AAE1XSI7_9LAMI|nr:hypothetical protein Salat_2504600 [Sesamum alatum]